MVLSGNPEKAALLIGASAGIFELVGVSSMAASKQFDHDYYLAEVNANLEHENFDTLWEKKKNMSVKEIVAYVLDQ
jgi:hypothetical protein